jgi:UDP-glucuronate 4-epimerase
MAVLVTGVAGFIGAAVAERLLARGEAVVGIDDFNDYYDPALKRARIARIKGGGDFTLIEQDFSDWEALEQALGPHEIDRIVHLGAQAGVRYSLVNPHAYARANLAGHLNLLEIARARGVAHMVYASSSSVYGGNADFPFRVEHRVDHPVSLYAATKKADELMSESYAHLYRIPLTGLRFFTVYGPWGRPDMAAWIFTSKILAGKPIPVFNDGAMRRDFTYVDDIVTGVVAALVAGSGSPAGAALPAAGGLPMRRSTASTISST